MVPFLSQTAFALNPLPEEDSYGLSMGDAVAAVVGGTHAIEWNPAGAARSTVPMAQLGLGYLPGSTELRFSTSVLYPFVDGTVFALSQYSDFPRSAFSNTTYVGTVALPLTASRDFLLGVNLKYLALSTADGVSRQNGRGLGLDLGFAYDLRDPEGTLASFALSVKDLNTDVRFDNMSEQPMVRTFVLGAAYQAIPDTRIEMDYDIIDQTAQSTPLHNRLRLGAERFFGDKSYSVRAGYDDLFGGDGYFSVGAGYHPALPFELSYAFRVSSATSQSAHTLSFIYRFDSWGAKEEPLPAAGSASASPEIDISALADLTRSPAAGRPVSSIPLHKMNIRVSPEAFSPSGSQKTATVSFPEDRSPDMARWLVEFQAADQKAVRRVGGTGPLPPYIAWDGMDESGRMVAAGKYRVVLKTFNGRNEMLSDDSDSVEIISPRSHFGIEPAGTYFSTAGRKGRGEIAFKVNAGGSRDVASWDFEISNASDDKVVYEVQGQNRLPLSLKWNGRNAGRQTVPDGAYLCLLTAQDKAGNSLKSDAAQIVISNAPPEVNLSPEKRLVDFSGDQAAHFGLSAADRVGIENWKLTVKTADGKPVKEFTSRGDPPGILDWDGTTDQGKPVDPGSFVNLVFAVWDKAGNSSETDPVPLQVDYRPAAAQEQMTLNLTTVYFDPGSSDLSEAGKKELQTASASIKPYLNKSTLVVKGYADAGETGDLLTLSHGRAEAVKKFMEQSLGVPDNNIYAVGYADLKEKSAATPAPGQSQRRAIITLTTQSAN